jgi:RNA polymerase sigma factor for flagellar operon FliA
MAHMPHDNPADRLPSAALDAARPISAAAQGADAPAMARAAAEYRAVDYCEMAEADIVRLHARTVKRIATRLQARLPDTVQLDDLMQAGFIAVLRAVRRGNVTPDGIPPLVLQRIISNAMIDEARRENWAPVRTVRLAKSAARAIRSTRQRLGRHGSDDEIAAEMNLALADYHALLVEIAGIRLLDLDVFGETGPQIHAADDQHAALDKNRMLSALTGAIAALPEREKTVVSLYYEHELNMEEVGKVLGVDKSTVCRAHGRALLNLRNALGDWAAGDRQAEDRAARQRPGE